MTSARAGAAPVSITDPGHPLCHDCAFCREYYDDSSALHFSPAGHHERTRYEAAAISRLWKHRELRRLRAYRDARGLTQLQLAARSGVPQNDISCLEQGTMNTRAVTATKLAVALGVEVEDLEGTA